jgi:hypothetical protein
LQDSLARLKTDELLTVLLMGPARTSAAYLRGLARLAQAWPVLGASFHEVHVVTAYDGSGPHRLDWLQGELLARGRGASVRILHDPENETALAAGAAARPHALILDRDGRVRHEGPLADERGYWRALAG